MGFSWIELFGTAASIMVAISLTMKNIRRLRILNAVGALAFAVYGIFIGSLPVWILNGFIVLIDVWYLRKMRATRDHFDVIECDPLDSPFMQFFLAHHWTDIMRYQPEFKLESGKGWLAEFILRDLNPVSLVIYRKIGEKKIEIGLDYAVPSYRDFKSAQFYFGKAAERIAAGQSLEFVQRSGMAEHQRYLEKLGFTRGAIGPDGLASFTKTFIGPKPAQTSQFPLGRV